MQAVWCSPPIAEVPSLHLNHCMWFSWWTKWSLGRFSLGFFPFLPITSFFPPFLHTHFIHLIYLLLWWCIRSGWLASLVITDLQWRYFIASHLLTQLCVGYELCVFLNSVDLLRNSKSIPSCDVIENFCTICHHRLTVLSYRRISS